MHAAFENPTSPSDAKPRIGIEARTIAISWKAGGHHVYGSVTRPPEVT